MRRRAFIGLGAAFIGAGAVYQTGAFDAIEADRATTIRSADDPHAFFGLDGYADPAPTPTITNQFSNPIQVTLTSSGPDVEFDVGETGSFEPVPVTVHLDPGQTLPVQINAAATSVTVDFDVTELTNGVPVGSISMSRVFAIPQALQVDITGHVKSAGASGYYEYGLTNVGSIDATLVGIGVIDTTNPNAEKVGGRPGDDIINWVNHNQQILTEEMVVDSTTTDVEVYELDQSIEFIAEDNGGYEQILAFDRFRQANNANADMRGVDINVYLQFEDSSTTVRLVADE